MRFVITAITFSVLPLASHAAESYSKLYTELSSGSAKVSQYDPWMTLSNITYASPLRHSLDGALSPIVFKSLDLTVDFTGFAMDIPRPIVGINPLNLEFTVQGHLNFSKNGKVADYAPLPYEFKVTAFCTDYCKTTAPEAPWSAPAISSVKFVDLNATPTIPYYPYDFSVAIDSISYGNSQYYLNNINSVELSLNYKYNGELVTKTMSDLTKSAGWSLDRAGRSQVERALALDSALSKLDLVKSIAQPYPIRSDGTLSLEDLASLKGSVSTEEHLRSLTQDFSDFVGARPAQSSQQYSKDAFMKNSEFLQEILQTRLTGGKTDLTQIIRAANLMGMGTGVAASALGEWLHDDPPDFDYQNLDHYGLGTGRSDVARLLSEAFSKGLMVDGNGSFEGMINVTNLYFAEMTAMGAAYERYSGAFLSGDLELANSHYRSYRLYESRLNYYFTTMANLWAAADQSLGSMTMPTLTMDDLNAAKTTLKAAIATMQLQGVGLRSAGDGAEPTIEDLQALLAELEGLDLSAFERLTLRDVMTPNYGQLALDGLAPTVPEASTTAMLAFGLLALLFRTRFARVPRFGIGCCAHALVATVTTSSSKIAVRLLTLGRHILAPAVRQRVAILGAIGHLGVVHVRLVLSQVALRALSKSRRV